MNGVPDQKSYRSAKNAGPHTNPGSEARPLILAWACGRQRKEAQARDQSAKQRTLSGVIALLSDFGGPEIG